jgi:hypothetical protein
MRTMVTILDFFSACTSYYINIINDPTIKSLTKYKGMISPSILFFLLGVLRWFGRVCNYRILTSLLFDHICSLLLTFGQQG